ncbi:Plasmodium exported protein, unknown function [Plasmodium sp. gorilla clade G2]|uniref:Plasmodium exported protein, unknown function n=1 Tax=Plasmodium sp. gorilla clade G2 TaxID=880535 RepID=UPI000D2283F9|nr:Plasmodium exported protein, unknown function [Plasmodium sp. gorilla clade G2]SOV19984.1 Plasmodium exported protein, unknown function [Plasmodium sp. gorilla clade G2]
MIFFQNKFFFRIILFWILYLINKTYFGRWEIKNIHKLIYTENVPRRILFEFDLENSNIKDIKKFNHSSYQMSKNEENLDKKNIYQILNDAMEKYDKGEYLSYERDANNEYIDFKKDKTISKFYDEFENIKTKNKIFNKLIKYLIKKYEKIYYKKQIKNIFFKRLKEKKKKIYSVPKGLYYASISLVLAILSTIILKLLFVAKGSFGITTIASLCCVTLFAKKIVTGAATSGTAGAASNPIIMVLVALIVLILIIVLSVFLYHFLKEEKNFYDQYDEQEEEQ